MSLAVVGTGGTIASLPDPVTGLVSSVVEISQLLASVAELGEFDISSSEEITRVNGWNISPTIMLDVARRVLAALERPEIDGVIVTHGTDTVEETAFLCDLLVGSEKPVVFCGSMRNGGQLSADGPRNLVNAARIASDPALRGYGTLLTLNDEVHAARWVRKLDSFRVSTFDSPGHAAVALVRDGHLIPMAAAPAPLTLTMPATLDFAVPILKTYTGMEAGLVDAVIAHTAARGIVLEGTGWGNVSGTAADSVQMLRGSGFPVVLATRTEHGGTGSHYGGNGGGATLREWGVVEAGGLTAAKARLLLMILLAAEPDAGSALEAFADAVQVLAPA